MSGAKRSGQYVGIILIRVNAKLPPAQNGKTANLSASDKQLQWYNHYNANRSANAFACSATSVTAVLSHHIPRNGGPIANKRFEACP